MQFVAKNIFRVSLVILLSTVSLCSYSQRYGFGDNWSMTPSFGTSSFFGDMKDRRSGFMNSLPISKYFWENRALMTGFSVDKILNPYFGIRGNINFGRIRGTKESSKLYFKANTFEYSLMGTIDFTNLIIGESRYRDWRLYGFIGIGLTESRSWKYNMVNDSLIQKYPTVGLLTEFVVPLGIGFNYHITKELGVTLEYSRHYINTDKLDVLFYEDQKFEGFGYLAFGITYNFSLPTHWRMGSGGYRYDGKSSDPSIRMYNKKKRVVMKTKSYSKSKNKRYKNGSTLKRKRPKPH